MNVTISERAKKILRVLARGISLSRAEIEKKIDETRINTIRELNTLVDLKYVSTSGEARATTYSITEQARVIVLWDAEDYLAEGPDARHARFTGIEPELFKAVKGIIGTPPKAIEEAALIRRKQGDSVTARRPFWLIFTSISTRAAAFMICVMATDRKSNV